MFIMGITMIYTNENYVKYTWICYIYIEIEEQKCMVIKCLHIEIFHSDNYCTDTR